MKYNGPGKRKWGFYPVLWQWDRKEKKKRFEQYLDFGMILIIK